MATYFKILIIKKSGHLIFLNLTYEGCTNKNVNEILDAVFVDQFCLTKKSWRDGLPKTLTSTLAVLSVSV